MTKDELRALMKEKRRALSADEISRCSEAITKRIMSLSCYSSARTVMIYLSSFKEPDTSALLNDILKTKKAVVPVSSNDDFTITPSYLKPGDRLIKGSYGIYEPEVCLVANPADIDIAVIPGLAFGRDGSRIGFGKGFYDRFLAEFTGVKIGVCYDFQVSDTVPVSEHDIGMDIIITEKGIYNDF